MTMNFDIYIKLMTVTITTKTSVHYHHSVSLMYLNQFTAQCIMSSPGKQTKYITKT